MKSLKVYGASDDLLELRGDIQAETYPPNQYDLLLDDGTLLHIEFGHGWTIEVKETGELTSYEKYGAGSETAEEITGNEYDEAIKLFNEQGFQKAFIIDEVKEVVKNEK